MMLLGSMHNSYAASIILSELLIICGVLLICLGIYFSAKLRVVQGDEFQVKYYIMFATIIIFGLAMIIFSFHM